MEASPLRTDLTGDELHQNILLLSFACHALRVRATETKFRVQPNELVLGFEAVKTYAEIVASHQALDNDTSVSMQNTLLNAFNILTSLQVQPHRSVNETPKKNDVTPVQSDSTQTSPSSHQMKLILLVQKFPYLYDRSHSSYNRNELKEARWQEIGTQMGVPAREARRRWISLRDRYKRLLNRFWEKWNKEEKYDPGWTCFPILHSMLYNNYIVDIAKKAASTSRRDSNDGAIPKSLDRKDCAANDETPHIDSVLRVTSSITPTNSLFNDSRRRRNRSKLTDAFGAHDARFGRSIRRLGSRESNGASPEPDSSEESVYASDRSPQLAINTLSVGSPEAVDDLLEQHNGLKKPYEDGSNTEEALDLTIDRNLLGHIKRTFEHGDEKRRKITL